MRVLISGSHGFIGGALVTSFGARALDVRPLVRNRGEGSIWWNPETGEINAPALNNWQPDAFIHLAGENIGSGRWTRKKKKRIRESRVDATQRLVASVLKLNHPPSIFVGASAVGYYGNSGDEMLTEQNPPGTDFLSEVARSWEAAAQPLQDAGLRVVHLRFGMILSGSGGALKRMLPIFKMGLGGRLGDGKQWLSWIALRDVLAAIHWALSAGTAHGPYNCVSPHPVRNREFTRALAATLNRPGVVPAPATLLRAAFGEMADALLLASQRAIPQRLLAQGFPFELPDLAEALRASLSHEEHSERKNTK